MVIDNAGSDGGYSVETKDATRRLFNYIPYVNCGRILITSRNKNAANKMVEKEDQIINIEPMNPADAESLIRKKLLGGENSKEVSTLARLLHGIPLAIIQSTAYISKDGLASIGDYILWFTENEEHRAKLLEKNMRDGYGDTPSTVLHTWELSFIQIMDIKTQAADLLSIMCFLDPIKIPEFLLCKDVKPFDFHETMIPLVHYSFVSKADNSQNYQMLDLVQIATRKWLRRNGKFELYLGKAMELVSDLFPNGEYESKDQWQMCVTLAPHAEMVLRYDMKMSETTPREIIARHASLMRKYTGYMWRQGQYNDCLQLCEASLNFHNKYLQDQPSLMLQSKALKGLVLNSTGKHGDAAKLHRGVLEERKRILGQCHKDTLGSINDLGQALRNQGEYKLAEEMFRKALDGRKKIPDLDQQDILTSLNDLAQVLVDQGKYVAAEEMFSTTIKLKEKALTKENPSTLATMEQLAELLAVQGKLEEAEKMHRQLLDLYTSVLGLRHPDTIWNLNGLAAVLLEQEKFEEAEKTFCEALELCIEVLGGDSPHTLSVMVNLAITLEKQQKYAEAEELYQKSLNEMMEMKSRSGEKHPYMRNCMEGLAMTMEEQGKKYEANGIRNRIETLDENTTPQIGFWGSLVDRIFWYLRGDSK